MQAHGTTLLHIYVFTVSAVVQSRVVISPGLSDHYIIDIEMRYSKRITSDNTREMRLYSKADVDAFQEQLWTMQNDLATMTDVNKMWSLFSRELKLAVKPVRPKPSNQPRWFNRKANKLVTKHRKTYNKYKDSGDPFLLTKYKQERRLHRAELRKIEQDYISTKICKPLETGNSKPFYQHLNWSQGVTKPPMILKTEGNDHTEDPTENANILNEFFSSQFCKRHQLGRNNAYNCTGSSIEVSDAGVDLREEDLVIDPIMTAKCLTSMFKVSLSTATLSGEWKLA